MKRLLTLVAAIIALGSTAFAGNGEYAVISKLNNEETLHGLSSYLGVNYDQRGYLEEIFELSAKKMQSAMKDGMLSEKDAKKAMAFNLANMKNVLSSEQYRKYLIVLNMTVNNANKQELLAQNK